MVSAEQSFKRAFALTKKVSDPIAKGVIETQLDRIQNMKREGSEMCPVVVSNRVTSMLVADVGDSFCQGQVGHVGDRLRYLRPI